MRPIRRVKIVYRNAFFFLLRRLLPRQCRLIFRYRGHEVLQDVHLGQWMEVGAVRRIRPARLIDAVAFVVLVSRARRRGS